MVAGSSCHTTSPQSFGSWFNGSPYHVSIHLTMHWNWLGLRFWSTKIGASLRTRPLAETSPKIIRLWAYFSSLCSNSAGPDKIIFGIQVFLSNFHTRRKVRVQKLPLDTSMSKVSSILPQSPLGKLHPFRLVVILHVLNLSLVVCLVPLLLHELADCGGGDFTCPEKPSIIVDQELLDSPQSHVWSRGTPISPRCLKHWLCSLNYSLC